MPVSQLVTQIMMNGIMVSVVLILIALGLTLIFGILSIVNFAHGELYMLGGFGAWFFFEQGVLPAGGSPVLRYLIALILSVIFVSIVGFIMERFFLRQFRGKLLETFIVTLGFVYLLQTSVLLAFGIYPKAMTSIFTGVVNIGGAAISQERLAVSLIGAVVVAAVYLFIMRSKTGRAMQAVAQDPEAAGIQGINIDRISSLGMAIGSGLAAAAGALIAPLFMLDPYMGTVPVVKAFIVIVLGGMGSIIGTVVAGFIVGFLESVSATFIGSDLANLITCTSIMVVLLVKPLGLFGHEHIHA